MKTVLIMLLILCPLAFMIYKGVAKQTDTIKKENFFEVNSKTTDKIQALKEQRRQQMETLQNKNKKLQEQRMQSY